VSTLSQRELDLRLLKLRTVPGMTAEEVGGEPLCPAAKISWMEVAAHSATVRDVRELRALYGVGGAGTANMVQFAQEGREQPWSTQDVCFKVWFRRQQMLERKNRSRYRALLDEAMPRGQVESSSPITVQLNEIIEFMLAGKSNIQNSRPKG